MPQRSMVVGGLGDDAVVDETSQPLREDIRRDTEALAELVESV